MKTALAILAGFTLAGCSQDGARPPAAPSPSAPSAVQALTVWALVVEASGLCIVGATVEVVGGQGLGQRITQSTPCDAWGYGGGAEVKDLKPGVGMTLRASAPGYAAQEKAIVPSGGPQGAIVFSLVPAR